MKLSAKQSELYFLEAHDYPIVLVPGVVQCGKTTAAVFALCRRLAKFYNSHNGLIVVQSDMMWQNSIQSAVRLWAKLTGHTIHWTKDHFTSTNDHGGLNTVYRLTGNNAKSLERLSGNPYSVIYATEVTFLSQDLIQELVFRTAAQKSAKIILDCNPASSQHWFYVDYILKADERKAKLLTFTEQDNPLITPEMWDDIKRMTPPGLPYRRRILGEWCDATGLVWDIETPNSVRQPPNSKPKFFDVSVDTATSSVTHALLVAHYSERYHVIDEWRYDGRVSGPMTVAAQVASIAEQFNLHTQVYGHTTHRWVIDPASAHFKVEVLEARRRGKLFGKVFKTNNNIKYGIDTVGFYLQRRLLTISPACTGLLKDIGGYMWKENTKEDIDDHPVKKDDHGCDALRYWCVMHNQSQRKRPIIPAVVKQKVGAE